MPNAADEPGRSLDIRALYFLGGSVLAISLAILIAWAAGHHLTFTGNSGSVAFAVHTTLPLLFVGLAILATATGRHRFAVGLIVAVLLITDGALLLLAANWNPDGAVNAIRHIDPNTAICFLCAGIALLLLCRPRDLVAAPRIVFICASLILAIAALAVAGHIFRMPMAYTWGRDSGMSAPVAVGFLLTALSLFLAIRQVPDPAWGERRGWLIPIVASATFAGVVAWIALTSLDRLITLTAEPADHAVRMETLRQIVSDQAPGDPEVTRRLEEMIHADQVVAAERAASGQQTAAQARGVIIFGSFVAFGLVSLAMLMLNQLQVDRGRTQRELEETNANLESRIEQRTRELVASRDQLASREKSLRFLADSMPQLVWTTNGDGVLETFNKRWREYTGLGIPELVSGDWMTVLHPADIEPTREAWGAMVRERRAGSGSYRIRRRSDGETRWHLWRAEPEYDTSGNLMRWIGTSTDIHDQKLAEESLEIRVIERTRSLAEAESVLRNALALQHAILDSAPYIIISTDLDGVIQRVNPAAERQLGWDAVDLTGRETPLIFHDENEISARAEELVRESGYPVEAGFDVLVAAVRTGQSEIREWTFVPREGSPFPVSLCLSPLRDGRDETIGFLAIAENISARREAAVRLQESAEQLREKNAELQEFVYAASHDLQEPLRKIQAFGDRLLARTAERLDADERDYLTRMQGAAARMQSLIEALLSYSRVTTTDRAFTEIDLAVLLQTVVHDLEIRMEKSGGRVEIGELPTLPADDVQLRQLFQNLIGNALKYHRSDEPPVVEVSAREIPGRGRRRAAWEFTVSDNGIGFEQKYAEAVFGVFQRLHGRGDFEGTGVGLAICRKIVERHGGKIRAESTPGVGSRFIFTLVKSPNRRPESRIAQSPDAP